MSEKPTEATSSIDLHFRPRSYFTPDDPLTHVLSSIKGADRRAYVKAMIAQGRAHQVPDYAIEPSLSTADRYAVAGVHPSCMGGEYLPDLEQDEVEIARITIASTMQDVTCVYARRDKNGIRYRVLDEFEGDTLTGNTSRTSKEPLTLAELADFFLGGWNLFEVLEMNALDNPNRADEARGFAWAGSEFYPGFKELIAQRIEAWIQEQASLCADDKVDEDESESEDD